MKFMVSILALFLLSALMVQRNAAPELTPYKLDIPEGFPIPNFPEGNELTQERVDLGRRLFYDPVLSVDSTISCASCHNQALAFADNRPVTPGVEGRLGNRNAPTLTNVAYNPTMLFDAFLTSLEMQILVPIQEHAELNHNIVDIAKILEKDSGYIAMSLAAYNRTPDPFVITRALSAFERTLISGNSKYDQQVYQQKNVMTPSEKRGMNLFFNELHCAKCHSGFNFTNFQALNNGLNVDYEDPGRERTTHLAEDLATFKVPTLRNIALTAPYMHDGSLASLEEVIEHYESGGKPHLNKSPLIVPFKLSSRQKRDLIRFLNCLTDYDFIANPNFANPF